MSDTLPYTVRRESRSRFLDLRGQHLHLREWGSPSPMKTTLVMLHGWMDVGASFQFTIDAMAGDRHIIAPDLRGFGLSEGPKVDSYWFPDHVADLEAVIGSECADARIDLLGHSMGGNVAMIYAGLRPERIRRLVNLEGFGGAPDDPDAAWQPYVQWLDELQDEDGRRDRRYGSAAVVARRIQENDPFISDDRALWLAERWARQGEDGRWSMLGDAAHKRINPQAFRHDDAVAIWRRIKAPLLWVEGDETNQFRRWAGCYTPEDFHQRLSAVAQVQREVLSPAGHMLHHDQPEALAALIDRHLA